MNGVDPMLPSGTWVLLETIVLTAAERATNLPEDTRQTPVRKWVKGALVAPAALGDSATVRTVTERLEQGVLVKVNPSHLVDYGVYIPELPAIAKQLRRLLAEGGDPHG